jgi:hypothetical protein
MKKSYLIFAGCTFGAVFVVFALSSWGAWGHKHINRSALFALPEEMRMFYYNHADFITEESVGPDQRKYTLGFKSEGPKHFIDIEAFDTSIDSLPRLPKEASSKYEENFLQKTGTLPWHIQEIMTKLTKAFQERKKADILLLSADLGHYLGDAHMPLHTSVNHDGQLTNQNGIHSFWESQLPDLFGDSYNLHTGNAKYIDDVTAETWRIIRNSHSLVDTLLATERNVNSSFPKEGIYVKDDKGNVVKNKFNQPVHTTEYARKYHEALHGMVERQMRAAIVATADFWYTAWVNAGKPELKSLDDEALTERSKEYYIKDLRLWESGKVFGLKADPEY